MQYFMPSIHYTVRKKGLQVYMKKGFPEWSVLEPF